MKSNLRSVHSFHTIINLGFKEKDQHDLFNFEVWEEESTAQTVHESL